MISTIYIRKEQSIPRIIVCGGDGSVLYIVEDMLKYGLNFQEIPIGIIPLGTGNDLSWSLGIFFNI